MSRTAVCLARGRLFSARGVWGVSPQFTPSTRGGADKGVSLKDAQPSTLRARKPLVDATQASLQC